MNTLLKVGTFFASLLLALPAFAVPRTFVASTGLDTNACSLTAPCRSFAAAVAVTDAGGEVIALDSAGYGTVIITKSVSIIVPDGIYGGITVSSGTGITINAGVTDVVILRGIALKGLGGLNGIQFNSGAALHVRNMVVEGFTGNGIASLASGELFVEDTVAAGNGASGIVVSAFSGTASASLSNIRVERNLRGLFISTLAKATVRQCVASGNTDSGIFVDTPLATAELSVEGCLVTNNLAGITSQGRGTGAATVRVSNSTITNNVTGLAIIGTANIQSPGNNLVRGNGTPVSGVLTPITGL